MKTPNERLSISMNTLHLTLKRKWFDMIASGEKLEEYREIKPYWMTRFRKRYDIVNFRNGYGRAAPRMRFALKEIKIGFGNQSWGAPAVDAVYILELGERLPQSETGSINEA